MNMNKIAALGLRPETNVWFQRPGFLFKAELWKINNSFSDTPRFAEITVKPSRSSLGFTMSSPDISRTSKIAPREGSWHRGWCFIYRLSSSDAFNFFTTSLNQLIHPSSSPHTPPPSSTPPATPTSYLTNTPTPTKSCNSTVRNGGAMQVGRLARQRRSADTAPFDVAPKGGA